LSRKVIAVRDLLGRWMKKTAGGPAILGSLGAGIRD
jgi:hypothetical protein